MMGLASKLRAVLAKKPKRRWILRPELLCSGNIPQPMHGVSPRTVLGARWWEAVRQEAFRFADYHCLACGVHRSVALLRLGLEGHEVYDIDYLLGRMVYIETAPLCQACHGYVHCGRLQLMRERKTISQARYLAIIRHGDRVLHKHGLCRRREHSGPVADWGDWRLIIGNREYPPKYPTFQDWLKEFG